MLSSKRTGYTRQHGEHDTRQWQLLHCRSRPPHRVSHNSNRFGRVRALRIIAHLDANVQPTQHLRPVIRAFRRRNVVLALTTLRRAQAGAHCLNTGLLTRCTQAESHKEGSARGTSDERSALLSFRLKIVRASAIFARPDDAVCITSMSRQRELDRQLVRPSVGRQSGPGFRGF